MARFPKLTSPCPYESQALAAMEGGTCGLCQRRVYDLMGLSETERSAFLAGCTEEICVSYSLPLPLRPAVAAAALAVAAFAAPTAVMAQDQAPAGETAAMESEVKEPGQLYVVIGGIKDPARAEVIDTSNDADLPELPVAYESEAAKQPAPPAPQVSDRPSGVI